MADITATDKSLENYFKGYVEKYFFIGKVAQNTKPGILENILAKVPDGKKNTIEQAVDELLDNLIEHQADELHRVALFHKNRCNDYIVLVSPTDICGYKAIVKAAKFRQGKTTGKVRIGGIGCVYAFKLSQKLVFFYEQFQDGEPIGEPYANAFLF